MIHFTKAPLFGFTEAEAAAMCLCAGWNDRDIYSRAESSVTCPECLKLIRVHFSPSYNGGKPLCGERSWESKGVGQSLAKHVNCIECLRLIGDDKPAKAWTCPACGASSSEWKPVEPDTHGEQQCPSGFIANPAYETATHEVEFKAHPDVWRKVRPVSGTYTVKPQP